jgi:DNA-binding NtrC family response regulator
MLVVDDEPDNLDLLYRTFRRDFNVLRAESGHKALEILAQQGEVAIIISDQRMPEMKGTEFLSKTVPEFPDTVRIILTGFTDVEDLVDAINAGQVYRYITKPWDPEELRHVVDQAAQNYTLLKQRGEAVDLSQNQYRLIMEMAEIAQTAGSAEAALAAIAQIIQTATDSAGCAVVLVEGEALTATGGIAGVINSVLTTRDPLVAAAIANKTPQFCNDATTLSDPDLKALYGDAQVTAQGIAPVLFRERVVAVVILQWQTPYPFAEAMQALVTMAAQQTALTLACL